MFNIRSTQFFFFQHSTTTEVYTLSLHDAFPIFNSCQPAEEPLKPASPLVILAFRRPGDGGARGEAGDRKSTRLNSSHANTSYAVFCLKKKHEAALPALPRSQIAHDRLREFRRGL